MRKQLALTAAALMAFSAVAAGPAESAADFEAEMAVGDSITVQGAQGAGTNANYFTDFTCSSSPDTYCQTVLVKLSNPYEEENAKKGRERASLDLLLTPTQPVNDFDMTLWEADADGNKGAQIGQSGLAPIAECETSCERINAVITTTEDVTEVYVLVEVVYFAAVGDWTLDASFTQ